MFGFYNGIIFDHIRLLITSPEESGIVRVLRASQGVWGERLQGFPHRKDRSSTSTCMRAVTLRFVHSV